MRRRLQQLRDLSPVATDRLVTALAFVAVEVSALADPKLGGTDLALTLVVGAIASLSTIGRRHRPLLALVIGLTAFLLGVMSGVGVSDNSGALLSVFVLAYSLGRHGDGRQLVAGGGVIVVVFTINAFYAADGFFNELAFDVLVGNGLPIVAGIVLRRRAALVSELQAQRGALERERDARVHDAAIAERVRIARELHDVVVHDVSEMVVQAAAAREIVRAQPQAAAAAIARVEGAGRGALDELRRALGVLRSDDRAMALEPQPTLAALDLLVERSEGHVELDIGESLQNLPADVQLTAYRIVEEVLADGAGAFGRAVVKLTLDDAAVTVEIRHDGPPPVDAGLGATRQRVEMFDGGLDISTDDGAGSRVCATLPLPISATG